MWVKHSINCSINCTLYFSNTPECQVHALPPSPGRQRSDLSVSIWFPNWFYIFRVCVLWGWTKYSIYQPFLFCSLQYHFDEFIKYYLSNSSRSSSIHHARMPWKIEKDMHLKRQQPTKILTLIHSRYNRHSISGMLQEILHWTLFGVLLPLHWT